MCIWSGETNTLLKKVEVGGWGGGGKGGEWCSMGVGWVRGGKGKLREEAKKKGSWMLLGLEKGKENEGGEKGDSSPHHPQHHHLQQLHKGRCVFAVTSEGQIILLDYMANSLLHHKYKGGRRGGGGKGYNGVVGVVGAGEGKVWGVVGGSVGVWGSGDEGKVSEGHLCRDFVQKAMKNNQVCWFLVVLLFFSFPLTLFQTELQPPNPLCHCLCPK